MAFVPPPFRRFIGKNVDVFLCEIECIVKEVRLSTLIQFFELDVFQELAVLIMKPGPAVDLGLVQQARQKTHRRIHCQDVVERPSIEIPFTEIPPILATAQKRQGV